MDSSENSSEEKKQNRPLRNLTSLSLKWLADRVRKAERIKEQLASGTYKVQSDEVARSISSSENKD